MNFIDRALEEKKKDDDFLQAMADIYSESEVREQLDRYPSFISDVIHIIDYDTEVQMEGIESVCYGTLSEKCEDILTALHNCGLESEYNCLQDAVKLSKQIDQEELDEDLIGEEWEKIDSNIALNNDYDEFWDKVREYINRNLDY